LPLLIGSFWYSDSLKIPQNTVMMLSVFYQLILSSNVERGKSDSDNDLPFRCKISIPPRLPVTRDILINLLTHFPIRWAIWIWLKRCFAGLLLCWNRDGKKMMKQLLMEFSNFHSCETFSSLFLLGDIYSRGWGKLMKWAYMDLLEGNSLISFHSFLSSSSSYRFAEERNNSLYVKPHLHKLYIERKIFSVINFTWLSRFCWAESGGINTHTNPATSLLPGFCRYFQAINHFRAIKFTIILFIAYSKLFHWWQATLQAFKGLKAKR
jgi:hypothetical protein